MAIDTSSLKTTLKGIFSAEHTAEEAANKIAEALETWIKTASVQVTAATGKIVVAGSATTQSNANPIAISGDPSSMTGGIS